MGVYYQQVIIKVVIQIISMVFGSLYLNKVIKTKNSVLKALLSVLIMAILNTVISYFLAKWMNLPIFIRYSTLNLIPIFSEGLELYNCIVIQLSIESFHFVMSSSIYVGLLYLVYLIEILMLLGVIIDMNNKDIFKEKIKMKYPENSRMDLRK